MKAKVFQSTQFVVRWYSTEQRPATVFAVDHEYQRKFSESHSTTSHQMECKLRAKKRIQKYHFKVKRGMQLCESYHVVASSLRKFQNRQYEGCHQYISLDCRLFLSLAEPRSYRNQLATNWTNQIESTPSVNRFGCLCFTSLSLTWHTFKFIGLIVYSQRPPNVIGFVKLIFFILADLPQFNRDGSMIPE